MPITRNDVDVIGVYLACQELAQHLNMQVALNGFETGFTLTHGDRKYAFDDLFELKQFLQGVNYGKEIYGKHSID